jgi:hypothetical protein
MNIIIAVNAALPDESAASQMEKILLKVKSDAL